MIHKIKWLVITKNGCASINLPDADSLTKATEALKNDFKVTPINKAEVKLLPKIKISEVNREYMVGTDNKTSKECLLGMITEKNDKIKSLIEKGGEFQIVYLNKNSG